MFLTEILSWAESDSGTSGVVAISQHISSFPVSGECFAMFHTKDATPTTIPIIAAKQLKSITNTTTWGGDIGHALLWIFQVFILYLIASDKYK